MAESVYQITDPLKEALARCARGDRSELISYLECSEENIQVGTTGTLAHSYFLKTNGNGQLVINELATFLIEQIIDYALPREKIQEAQRQLEQDGTSGLFSRIHNKARRLFVSSENSGEAGELLLFSFAERIFRFPQLLSKMSLKTSDEMHYHGADGVFAQCRNDGGLNLYWGEAKIHSNVSSAINEAFKSLAPFLNEPRADGAKRSQDLFLINSHLDLGDANLTERIKLFFKSHTDEGRSIKYCGFALVGFDSASYQDKDNIAQSVKEEFQCLVKAIDTRITTHELTQFDIHIICLPFKSAEEFRSAFANELGLSNAA